MVLARGFDKMDEHRICGTGSEANVNTLCSEPILSSSRQLLGFSLGTHLPNWRTASPTQRQTAPEVKLPAVCPPPATGSSEPIEMAPVPRNRFRVPRCPGGASGNSGQVPRDRIVRTIRMALLPRNRLRAHRCLATCRSNPKTLITFGCGLLLLPVLPIVLFPIVLFPTVLLPIVVPLFFFPIVFFPIVFLRLLLGLLGLKRARLASSDHPGSQYVNNPFARSQRLRPCGIFLELFLCHSLPAVRSSALVPSGPDRLASKTQKFCSIPSEWADLKLAISAP